MKTFGNFMAGVLLGGIVGSVAALLLTPSSGKEVRDKIVDKYNFIHDEVENAAKQRSDELKQELARLQNKA